MPQDDKQPQTPRRWKTIPVFISSTFRDMQAERDALNRWVFPALEARLRERCCRLEPIDLRVGVDTTEAGSEREREQQILKVCLQEIDRSRPFLMVLLGDRYGWVPDEDRIRAAAGEADFTTDTQGRSVTSLEIEYGMLHKNPEQRRRSILLLREPLPYDSMGAEAAVFSDAHATDPGAPARARHLTEMKRRLIADPLLAAHIHRYSLGWDEAAKRPRGLEAWARMVEEAFWQQLDEETAAFAREPDPTWQEQERFNLEEFTERLDGCFAGREALVNEAVEFLLGAGGETQAPESRGQIRCATAESGAGKSAFFARNYWRLRRRLEKMPAASRPILLAEAGGISSRAGRLYWLLRRWTGELAAEVGVRADLPEELKVQELEGRFAEMLSYAVQQRPVILMADALNQFERTDRMAGLSWLPDPLPPNVRLLATAISGPESERLARRGGRVVPLPAFSASEIVDVAKAVYARYHRTPNPEVIRQLAAIERPDGQAAAGNALWLSLALELLNLLDADDFAEAERDIEGSAVEKLHRLVLKRCGALPGTMEGLYADFLKLAEKAAGRVEVRCFASLIALSRAGWREEDLEPMLPGAAQVLFPGQQPPTWDPLRFAVFRRFFRAHMVPRGEFRQLDFTHASLRSAIRAQLHGMWKPGAADPIPALHAAIADQLETTLKDDPRRPDETMWQCLEAREPRRFNNFSFIVGADHDLLISLLLEDYQSGNTQLLEYVLSPQVRESMCFAEGNALPLRILDDLRIALGRYDGRHAQMNALQDMKWMFSQRYQSNSEDTYNGTILLRICNELADIYQNYGPITDAINTTKEAITILNSLMASSPSGRVYIGILGESKNRISQFLHEAGDDFLALEYLHESMSSSQKGVLMPFGEAMKNPGILCHSVESSIWNSVATNYSLQGEICAESMQFGKAFEAYSKAIEILEGLGGCHPPRIQVIRDLSLIYGRVGELYHQVKQETRSLSYFQKAIAIARQLHEFEPKSAVYACDLARIYSAVGECHADSGHYCEAKEMLSLAIALEEELYARDTQFAEYSRVLLRSYGRMAKTAKVARDDDALAWLNKMAKLSDTLKSNQALRSVDELFVIRISQNVNGESSPILRKWEPQNRSSVFGYASGSPPHRSADGARAAQLNVEYQQALKEWQALPWLKRMRVPKPTPPTGI